MRKNSPAKRNATYPALCGGCGRPIDLEAVQAAIRQERDAFHECGRLLYRGQPK